MAESLLAHALTLLDEIEAPVLWHRDCEAFPSDELQALRATGILRETSKATEIPRLAGMPPGGDLVVRRTERGLYGVADEDDFFEPVPLTDDDVRQYQVSVLKLLEAIRAENNIDGRGTSVENGFAHLGRRTVDGFGAVDVHACLSAHDEETLLSRCQRLRRTTGSQRAVVLVSRPVALSGEAHEALDSAGVVLACLLPAARDRSLKLDWKSIVGTPDPTAGTISKDARAFVREGSTWRIVYDGTSSTVKHSKGMEYIASLLDSPYTPIHSAILRARAAGQNDAPVLGSGSEVLTKENIEKYREQLRDMKGEIDEAERENDLARLTRLKVDEAALTQELARAVGYRGRRRRVADDRERARQSVSKAITRALDAVEKAHKALGQHLRNTLKIGSELSYEPDQRITWLVKT